MTPVRVLYAAAAALAVPALVLWALPASPPRVHTPPPALPDGPSLVLGSGPSPRAYDTIATADPFSPRRTPPSVRFVPAGGEHRPMSVPRPAGPKVYGITVGPEGSVAVISAEPGVRRAQLYGIGDTLAGARVVAISDSTVTLTRATGTFTLHLEFAGQHTP